jgi:hypothetical protein
MKFNELGWNYHLMLSSVMKFCTNLISFTNKIFGSARISQLPSSSTKWLVIFALTCGLYYKSVTVVVYCCSNRGLYYKCVMTSKYASTSKTLALAFTRSLNYDRKVWCKLKRTFTIINYNRNTFTVQATGPNVIKL